jgi:hypothetical protein
MGSWPGAYGPKVLTQCSTFELATDCVNHQSFVVAREAANLLIGTEARVRVMSPRNRRRPTPRSERQTGS